MRLDSINKGVVKQQAPAALPVATLAASADPELHAVGTRQHEGKVDTQPMVAGPSVWGDACARRRRRATSGEHQRQVDPARWITHHGGRVIEHGRERWQRQAC